MGQAGRKPTDLSLGSNVWNLGQTTNGQEFLVDVATVRVLSAAGTGQGRPLHRIGKETLRYLTNLIIPELLFFML